MPCLTYTRHARDMLRERRIEESWVERTVLQPESVETDVRHPERSRAFRRVPERDGRMLRVVYAREEDDLRIITVFLDRTRR